MRRQQEQQELTQAMQQQQEGTVPGQFPPDPNMQVGQIAVANKQGITAAFSSTVFFTAPVSGWYAISASVKINSTDGAGTLSLAVVIPNYANLPGVQANLATPANGTFPAGAYYLASGAQVTGAVTVGSLGATNVDVWLFAQRLN